MPRSVGVYTAPASSWNPAVNGASATLADWNALLADLSSGLTQSVSKDGQTAMTGNLAMGSNKITGLAAGTTAGDSARYEQVTSAVAITGGTINGATIGATTPSTGAFTTVSATGTANNVITANSTAASGGALVLQQSGAAIGYFGNSNYITGGTLNDVEVNVVSGAGKVNLSVQNTRIASVSSTGLAVTGALSATGAISSVGTNYFAGGAASTQQIRVGFTDGTSYWNIGRDNVSTGNLIIGNAGTTQATLDTSGNLYLATVSQIGSGKMSIAFVPGSSQGLNFKQSIDTSSPTPIQFFNAAGTVVGSVTTTAAATAFNTSSDQRLKENIADADQASDLLDSLHVRKFTWKADGSNQRYGFVAQELVTVFPEAVHQPENTEEMMAVDYSKLVPLLVKEIQSLRQRLTAAGIA